MSGTKKADGRTGAKHSRADRPVGTVVIRRCHAKRPARWIKARPGRKGWEAWARWWWRTNRGPIPPGKRVLHLDGDTLNDDPANLALGGPADSAFLWLKRAGAAGERKMYAALRAGCRRRNRDRAAAARALGVFFATLWYAVDHAARTVSGPHGKKLRMAAAALAPGLRKAGTGKGLRHAAAVCGLAADCTDSETAVLMALRDGPLATPGLMVAAAGQAALLSVRCPAGRHALHQLLWQLRQAGLVASRRGGSHHSSAHRLTGAGLEAVAPAAPRACVRGGEARRLVEREGYAYRPVMPEGGEA